ncbi:MAG TPA: choice-of-anchor tandem repeat GloVer-containing protein [Pseudomonadales bacterium]|nr:choice-of-anchor tandem repeat GloVer-containing protein [Pseudomonadales bacterium]
MKIFAKFCVIAVLFLPTLGQSQTATDIQANQIPSPTPPAIVSRDANSRVWQWTEYQKDPNGQAIPKSHSYTELASGLCYQQNGQWLDSQEQIVIQPDGSASCITGQHQVYFPSDIAQGVITLVMPDGTQLRSQPIGLSYDDGTNTVLIAALTNSVGELISANQILYPNAFTGVQADLLYTYTKAGFEQNIIIREQPPSPGNFGLNSESASLQMETEFFNASQPAISEDESEEFLDFGTMQMVPGKAFLLGTNAPGNAINVSKSWISVSGRQILVEQVPVMALADELSELPPVPNATAKVHFPSPLHIVSSKRLLPGPRPISHGHQKIVLARNAAPRQGIDLDYTTLTGFESGYTFTGDGTYLISGTLLIGGVGFTTIEGGAVIKFTNNATIYVEDNLVTPTNAYRMAVLTSWKDNSVGEAIYGSTGNPVTTANTYLSMFFGTISTNALISNLRFAYAGTAIWQNPTGPLAYPLWNSQFLNCGTAVNLDSSSGAYPLTLNLYNDLFSGCGTVLTNGAVYYGGQIKLAGQNITVDNANILLGTYAFGPVRDTNAGASTLTNSILTGVSHQISYAGAGTTYASLSYTGSCYAGSSTGIYQAAGAANYYLATSSTCRAAGTSGINPSLLAQLQQKTTWPPIVISNITILAATNFSPQVSRDTNASPDLGYHYDPLDYLLGGVRVTNANVTVSPGTVIGGFGLGTFGAYTPYSLDVEGGGIFNCQGLANQFNRFVEYNTVQEELPKANWAIPEYYYLISDFVQSSPTGAVFNLRFTWFSSCAQDDYALALDNNSTVNLRDCEFHSGLAYSDSVNITNCLFDRVQTDLEPFTGEFSWFYNNLIYGGSFELNPPDIGATNAAICNNLFDLPITNALLPTLRPANGNYNAFYWPPSTNTYFLNGMLLTNAPVFQAGPLGNFYQTNGSLTIHAGNTNASLLGLYWYTTQTSQAPQSNSIVDIGYHYVATDTNGNPLDYLDPPTPNYISYPDGPPSNSLAIIAGPVSQTVTIGSAVTFSVTATGIPPLGYQWYWNGAPLLDAGEISGSGNSTLTLSGVNPDQAGSYYVVVTNSFGSLTSTSAVLTVLLQPTNNYDTFPLYLMPPYAYWEVTDISDPAQPVSIGELQAPYSEPGYNEPDIPPYNTPWHTNTSIPVPEGYGTTSSGGTYGYGTVYKINLTNGTFTVLHSFDNSDGANPCSQLAESGSAFYGIPVTVYGTTFSGGTYGYGMVFKVNADGTGFTNLYEFTGGADGGNPQTGLLISGNTLYGTTTNSIFKINTDGSDFTCLTNIDGASQLLLSPSGYQLYGTTSNGGSNNDGSVFSINTDGTDFTNIYNFDGGINGGYPSSGLELFGIGSEFTYGASTYTLYGTTAAGGTNGYGIVYSINTDGSNFNNLHDFDSTNDGATPLGGLLITNNAPGGQNVSGTWLFGTTSMGGPNGGGTVFGMNPVDGSAFQTINSFGGASSVGGSQPEGRLSGVGGVVYGTTSRGGVYTNGTIFCISNSTDFVQLYSFRGGTNGGLPLAGLMLAVVDTGASIWSLDATLNLSSQSASNAVYSTAVDNDCTLFVNGLLFTTIQSGGG